MVALTDKGFNHSETAAQNFDHIPRRAARTSGVPAPGMVADLVRYTLASSRVAHSEIVAAGTSSHLLRVHRRR